MFVSTMNLYILLTLFSILRLYSMLVYVSTEHPKVTFVNKKYFSFITIATKRYKGNIPPVYYVEMHGEPKILLNDNFEIHFYIYEYLSNEYRRSFVEMHNRGCGFLTKNLIFGVPLRNALNISCPVKPGTYHLYNMSIIPSYFPPNFPFKKGRIYCNATVNNETAASGYIDMEVKEYNEKNTNMKNSTRQYG